MSHNDTANDDASTQDRFADADDKFEAMAEHQQQGEIGGGHALRTHNAS